MTKSPRPKRDRSAYYAEWYAKNSERLSKARRERYASDPKRRKAVLARAKAYYRARKLRGLQADSTIIDGQTVYTTGQLAAKLGISPQTVLAWERRGCLGPAAYQSPRAYTMDQYKVARRIAALLTKSPRMTGADQRLATLLARWPT